MHATQRNSYVASRRVACRRLERSDKPVFMSRVAWCERVYDATQQNSSVELRRVASLGVNPPLELSITLGGSREV